MWIDLAGLANLRDVGGIPTTDGGKIIPGRLLRSDNLQTLTSSDVDQLLGLGLTDVIDLRSDYEADREGPGPLIGSDVRIHQFSFFREWEYGVGETKPDVRPEVLPEEALPWIDLEPSVELDDVVASVYFSYLVDRPDSVLAALRTVARAPGTALVHCAAGKDRTGTLVALALSVAEAERQAIIDDYAASSERVEQVDLRRQPQGSAHFLTPQPPRDHDQLLAVHRRHVWRCVADVDQDGLDCRRHRPAACQASRVTDRPFPELVPRNTVDRRCSQP
jgi:protein-tyrosine phosphatase